MDPIETYLTDLGRTLQALPRAEIATLLALLRQARAEGRTVYLLGNGGSASTAAHFVCDLAKTAGAAGGPRLRAIALTDNIPLLTAWANDRSYAEALAEIVATLVQPGDLVIAISASGRSENVRRAVEAANARDAVTVGLTGFDGGDLRRLCRYCLVVPSQNMQHIEDAHLVLLHLLVSCLRDEAACPSGQTARP